MSAGFVLHFGTGTSVCFQSLHAVSSIALRDVYQPVAHEALRSHQNTSTYDGKIWLEVIYLHFPCCSEFESLWLWHLL